MGNGMYCDVEAYTSIQQLPDEVLLRQKSRKSLDYLKDAQRRLVGLMAKLAHHKRNPLGSAMCKDLETRIYQQSLIIKRFHSELIVMAEEYNRMSEESDSMHSTLNQQSSSLADWEEVIEMAKRPVEDVISHSQPIGGCSSHNGRSSSSSNSDTFFKTIYQSPLSDATVAGSADQAAGAIKGVMASGTLPPAPPPTAASSSSNSDGRTENKTFYAPLRRIPQKTFPWQMTPPMEEIVEFRQRLRELEQSPLFASQQTTKKVGQNGTAQPAPKVTSHSSTGKHHQHHQHPHQQQQKQQQPELRHSSTLRYQQLQAPRNPLYSFP